MVKINKEDYTGKLYRCKSLIELYCFNWAHTFSIGLSYKQVRNDFLGSEFVNEDVLLLDNGSGYVYAVDKMQFEEMLARLW